MTDPLPPANITVAIYLAATGQLLRTVSGTPGACEQNIHPGERGLEVSSPPNEDREYVVEDPDPRRRPRPPLNIEIPAYPSAGTTFSANVPVGAQLIVDGEQVAVADEAGLEIEFETMGEFMVEIVHWPYQTARQFVRVL